MACSVYAGELTKGEVLAYIKDRAANLVAYKADFTMKMSTKEGEVTTIGRLTFKKPNKLRMELDIAGPIKESQIMVSDGRYRWQYIPEKAVAFKIDMDKVREQGYKYADDSAQDISDPLVGMKEEEINYKGKQELNGEDTFLIEGRLVQIQGDDIPASHRAEVYIGQDGIARRYVIYDDNGAPAIEQIFSNIQYDAKMDDGYFIFSPPEGVEVIDSTGDIIGSLQEANIKKEAQ